LTDFDEFRIRDTRRFGENIEDAIKSVSDVGRGLLVSGGTGNACR
jgi:tRNA A37 N6-isopentenylltransferase MiaA